MELLTKKLKVSTQGRKIVFHIYTSGKKRFKIKNLINKARNRSSYPEVFLVLCNFIEITLRYGFTVKFTAYFQNTFSPEHLWTAASEGKSGFQFKTWS